MRKSPLGHCGGSTPPGTRSSARRAPGLAQRPLAAIRSMAGLVRDSATRSSRPPAPSNPNDRAVSVRLGEDQVKSRLDCQLAERRSKQPPLLVGHPAFLGRQYLDGDMVGAGFEVLADSSDDRVDVTPRNQAIDEGVAAARRS